MKNINHPNYYRKEITIFVEKKKKGMIDQATIDRIMAATDIVEVVSDFVSLRKRGANYWGLCPFHDDKTPSFSVSQSKGVCKCFSCGKGGSKNTKDATAKVCLSSTLSLKIFSANRY